jgi:DNA-binding CsgD family transcriptional regulator
MLEGKQIAIISPNCLIGFGLRNILTEIFSPEKINIFFCFDEYVTTYPDIHPDFIFVQSQNYVLHYEYYQPLRNKVIVLTQNDFENIPSNSSLALLDMYREQSDIIDQLERIFRQRINYAENQYAEELTNREIEVLKLVAQGFINKQIADVLCISTHTVISHRKNITRKLGISTVSGLTVYALINGLINSDQLHNNKLG